MPENNRLIRVIEDKRFLNRLFVGLMGLLELIILGAIAFVSYKLIIPDKDVGAFELIALLLLLLWFGILIAYYAWAIYFYNLNLGLTNEGWARLKEKVKFNPEAEKEIPVKNPNDGETLGLPKGTVRGSLALTLMIGALSMTIIAIGMDDTLGENEFLVDNFDFFKTAFLMMIAFYFGNKSLEMIGYKSKRVIGRNNTEKKPDSKNKELPFIANNDATKAKQLLRNGTHITSIPDVQNADGETDEFYVPGAVL